MSLDNARGAIGGTIYQYEAGSEADTEKLASALSAALSPRTTVTLEGDLGAGKTRFAQAVGAALGVKGIINSPTFTLIKEYEGTSMPFYHMDLYRISQEEAEELGLEEYWESAGVSLVEWASRIPDLLPEERLEIDIRVTGPYSRQFRLIPHGTAVALVCERLKQEGVLQ